MSSPLVGRARLFAALVVIAFGFGTAEVLASQSGADGQPNILFIFLDDLGWKDTGYMGSDFYETPHIDKLARGGMVFTDAYSCAANCAPARASLLSGQYTPRHQIYNVGTKPRGNSAHRRLQHVPGVSTLDPSIKTWAHQLQAAGYETATMGKWHLSDDPVPYGFDVNIGGSHSGGPPKGYYPPHPNAPGLKESPQGEFLTDRLCNEACEFIKTNKDKRWMLYLTLFAVHTPIQAKKELVEKYESKQSGELHNHVAMATMIQAVDDGVGRIVETLELLELRDDTVIFFYSDNGGYGPATDMDPLKGYKGTYYEGGIRVPFFINWPGVVQPEQTNKEPIIGVDIYPTLCEIAGASLPENQVVDGVSLIPLFKGEVEDLNHDGQPRTLYWHFPAYLQSYQRVHDEQRDPLFRSRPCSVIRKGKWKLIQFFESGDVELYDLSQDLSETNDVAADNLSVMQTMQSELRDWQTKTNATIPATTNPDFDEAAEAAAIKKLKSKSNGNRKPGKSKSR